MISFMILTVFAKKDLDLFFVIVLCLISVIDILLFCVVMRFIVQVPSELKRIADNLEHKKDSTESEINTQKDVQQPKKKEESEEGEKKKESFLFREWD